MNDVQDEEAEVIIVSVMASIMFGFKMSSLTIRNGGPTSEESRAAADEAVNNAFNILKIARQKINNQ